MNGCGYIICPVLVWHYIGIFVFGCYKCMVITSLGLYFHEFVHKIFLHSLGCNIVIYYWILGIFGFLELLCYVC
jgi:hypothetical protein